MPRRRARTWLLAGAIGVLGATLTSHRICDLVHDCGCSFIFLGGAAHCDIHRPGPPDCPACTTTSGGIALFGGVFGGWLALGRLGAGLWLERRSAARGMDGGSG